jgi:hypothetical protein
MEMNCKRCFSPIREGERVSVLVEATYHILKSKIAYALDKEDLVADPESLVHAQGSECHYEEGF